MSQLSVFFSLLITAFNHLIIAQSDICGALKLQGEKKGQFLLPHLWGYNMHGRNFSQLTDGVHYSEAELA